MTRTTRTLTAALATALIAVVLADQARHTTCPCGTCGGQR